MWQGRKGMILELELQQYFAYRMVRCQANRDTKFFWGVM